MNDQEILNLLFASCISADNEELTEETKQEMISRYTEQKDKESLDWEYITAPMESDNKFKKLIEHLNKKIQNVAEESN